MSLVSTKTPIFDDIPSIEFFNGRLLSGEDMTTEQAWNAARRKQLGQAIGSGVAFGLEVSVSIKPEHASKPIVTVEPGLALNADGATLSLTERTDVSLVQIEEIEAPPAEFGACQPTQYSAYVKSDGVYLLTLCPAKGTQGRAPISGLANQEARCNRKYQREGVQFRLHQLKLTEAELADRDKLRNLVAYKCFNPDAWQAFVTDPFGSQETKPQLLDGLLVPKLENSEVPLATIFWTTDRGIEHVDLWSVRRRAAASLGDKHWTKFVCARVLADARLNQFQAHLDDLLNQSSNANLIEARDHFGHLPPSGIVPLFESRSIHGIDLLRFFFGQQFRRPVYINGARFGRVVTESFLYQPIVLNQLGAQVESPMLWLYLVRENAASVDTRLGGAASSRYAIFASGQMPFLGEARFDVGYWNYSNYSSPLV